jgi:hypothetical protein
VRAAQGAERDEEGFYIFGESQSPFSPEGWREGSISHQRPPSPLPCHLSQCCCQLESLLLPTYAALDPHPVKSSLSKKKEDPHHPTKCLCGTTLEQLVNQQESAVFVSDLQRAEDESRMIRDAMADAKLHTEEQLEATGRGDGGGQRGARSHAPRTASRLSQSSHSSRSSS